MTDQEKCQKIYDLLTKGRYWETDSLEAVDTLLEIKNICNLANDK